MTTPADAILAIILAGIAAVALYHLTIIFDGWVTRRAVQRAASTRQHMPTQQPPTAPSSSASAAGSPRRTDQ